MSFGAPHSLPGVPVAAGHPHPFAPGDTLPTNCFTTPHLYDIQQYGGASGPDITAALDDSLPFYIIDKNSIYAYPVGTTRKTAKSLVKRYPRVDPGTGCVLP